MSIADISAALEAALASSSPRSKLRKAQRTGGVRLSPEFQRVTELPRRQYTEEETQAIVMAMTEALKTPHGQMILRAAQALGLLEAGMYRGLMGPIRVGGGKTLVSLLVAYVLGSIRPLLVLPANAIDPTRERQRALSEHWRIPYWLHYVSYESLGRKSHEKFLEELNPDCIIEDEAHMSANPKAGVTRRLKRFIRGDKSTGLGGHDIPVIVLSGTLTKRSLKNYAHLADWSLKDRSPLPRTYSDVEQWADVIDERPVNDQKDHFKAGALVWFSGGVDDQVAIREGFANHLLATPGVIGTFDPGPTCSLEVHRVTVPHPEEIRKAFYTLRKHWASPDGWLLMGGLEKNRVARQLAVGFYYRPVERPPTDWLIARRAWHQFVRHTIQYNRLGIDTESVVALACAHGKLDPTIYNAWRAIKDTFKLKTEAVWIDGYCVEAAAKWLENERGLVFCEHIEFAEMLSALTGVPYFGKNATSPEGVHIEQHKGRPGICSLPSCHKIWNLQEWNRGLVVAPPSSGQWCEQLLGRFHRDGQLADLVQWDFMVQCLEHNNAVAQARRDANYVEQTQVQVQKLNIADWRWFNDPIDSPFDRTSVFWDKGVPAWEE
jgi:hypothetical protein